MSTSFLRKKENTNFNDFDDFMLSGSVPCFHVYFSGIICIICSICSIYILCVFHVVQSIFFQVFIVIISEKVSSTLHRII